MLENHDLKLSRKLAKNHFAFCHVSCSVSLAIVHKSWAHCETLSWKFATFCAACSGKTVHATLLIESFTTFPADVATFDTAQTAQFTTDVHVSITFVVAFHTTFVAVVTLHLTTAFHDSRTHPPDVTHATISQNHSLIFCHTPLIHSIVFWEVSFSIFHHCSIVSFTDSTHWDAADFTHSIHACQTHLIFSTPEFNVSVINSLPSSIRDFSWTSEFVSTQSVWVTETLSSKFSWIGATELASCAGTTGVPTFWSSCVCVIVFV